MRFDSPLVISSLYLFQVAFVVMASIAYKSISDDISAGKEDVFSFLSRVDNLIFFAKKQSYTVKSGAEWSFHRENLCG